MELKTGMEDRILTLTLLGELDHHAARSTMRAITDLVDTDLPRRVVLDFGGLSFMDSSGIALILKVKRLAEQRRGEVWVEHPNRQVLRVLEASGIGKLVPIAIESQKE